MSDESIMRDEDATARSWVRLFREDVDRRYVSDDQVDRAATIIGTAARMAVERGYAVVDPSRELFDEAKRSKWPWPHLVVRDEDGFRSSFHVSELSKPGSPPKPRTLTGVPKSDAPQWLEGRSREFEPTGMLSLRVNGERPFARQRSLRDTVNSRMDERLSTLFDGLAHEIVASRERVEAGRRHEETVEQAQRACRGERLYTALCEEVRLHEDLQNQRAYLDLVEQRLRRTDPERLADASEDIELMRSRIDARDPLLSGGVDWSDQPDPTDVDVYEYMRRDRHATAFGHEDLYGDRAHRPPYRPPYRSMPSIGSGFFD
ncbi:hypothetical protein [Bifidobacterium parmae]|uniref:Uncharacterized protein n=1 Tax=Bifidobacterium parmae TaxID=361854 RepID=A0A2N5IZ39_9BIFI|nr:hypothetical protein [Bifidobacterium parmae]PLS27225.1 hypothetical protein Uis4E_1621 [Bifidobacterium parmae]